MMGNTQRNRPNNIAQPLRFDQHRPAKKDEEQRVQGVDFGDDCLIPQQGCDGPGQCGQPCPKPRFPPVGQQVTRHEHGEAHAGGAENRAEQIAPPGRVTLGPHLAACPQPGAQHQHVEGVARRMGNAVHDGGGQQLSAVGPLVSPGEAWGQGARIEQKREHRYAHSGPLQRTTVGFRHRLFRILLKIGRRSGWQPRDDSRRGGPTIARRDCHQAIEHRPVRQIFVHLQAHADLLGRVGR